MNKLYIRGKGLDDSDKFMIRQEAIERLSCRLIELRADLEKIEKLPKRFQEWNHDDRINKLEGRIQELEHIITMLSPSDPNIIEQ